MARQNIYTKLHANTKPLKDKPETDDQKEIRITIAYHENEVSYEVVHSTRDGRTCDSCKQPVITPNGRPFAVEPMDAVSIVMMSGDRNAVWRTLRKPNCLTAQRKGR